MYAPLRVLDEFSYSADEFCSPGIMLVGDAACFVDPVFSTGVHLATYGGLLAARTVNSHLDGSLRESEAYDAFSERYRREFAAQYKFLVGFYDMNAEREAYYWRARSVLSSEEPMNEAFVRLISGAGTTGPELFQRLQGAGAGFSDQVARSRGTLQDMGESVPTPAAFEIERSDGAADDLVPAAWRAGGRGGRGSAVPGAIVASDDGLSWRRVGQAEALLPAPCLRWRSRPWLEVDTRPCSERLLVRVADVDISFETPRDVAFGKTLAELYEFRAGDALHWRGLARYHDWPSLRERLDHLIAVGALVLVEDSAGRDRGST